MDNPLIARIGLFVIIIIIPLVLLDALILLFLIKEKEMKWCPALMAIVISEVILIKRICFPTFWKYPDRLILSDVVRYEDVEEVFGKFDREGMYPDYKAYYIYTDDCGREHYYYIGYDTEGFISYVEDRVL